MVQKKAAEAAEQERDAKVGKFIMFPLPLLQKICQSQDGFDKCIDFGVLYYAKTLRIDEIIALVSVARYYGYCSDFHNFNNRAWISFTKQAISCLIDISECKNSWPTKEVLAKKLGELSQKSRELIMFYAKVLMAQKNLDLEPQITDGLHSYDFKFPEIPPKTPTITVNVKWMIEQRDRVKKSKNPERERILFCLQMGISSIIGMRREWCATTQDMMKARMFGFSSSNDMNDFTAKDYTVKWLKGLIAKYTTRRIFDGLIKEILKRGWCKTIVGTSYRKTIVSIYRDIEWLEPDVRAFFRHNVKTAEKRKSDRQKAMYFITGKYKE